ncbi:uncharacterized protein LOC110269283 [Arachis ipaensis]|uniref:uncharacterized protein LOC110269283 n=1 Tax=Arachis ipaensis TaxID=130454 RepID=UPI000A2B0007|nr:uncharacterized protein LOC110269283 [Arachis ipaensis]XP_025636279.1 uncharacterized protein LOC112730406 [Arachis hypogaea]
MCNGSDASNPMADLISAAHCVENRSNINKVDNSVYSISNEVVDFTFDCIYDLEPLGFEKHSVKDDDHYKGFESQDPLEEINLGTLDDVQITYISGNEILSFMDSYSGYNQIFIAEDDVSKTAFRCPGALGTYEWVVMLFGLKNAGATYQ